MKLEYRLNKLERAAAEAGLEPPCPSCDYPRSSVRVIFVESDRAEQIGQCAECGRTLGPEGQPVTFKIYILDRLDGVMDPEFSPEIQALLEDESHDPLGVEIHGWD